MNTQLTRTLRTGLLCLLALGSTACQNPKVGKPAPSTSASADNAPPRQREAERLTLCQTQLGVLQTINLKHYQQYKQAFDHLMNSASRYARLRAQVNDHTQETVDALYQYKINYLCAGISQAVLTGLTKQEEMIKEEPIK